MLTLLYGKLLQFFPFRKRLPLKDKSFKTFHQKGITSLKLWGKVDLKLIFEERDDLLVVVKASEDSFNFDLDGVRNLSISSKGGTEPIPVVIHTPTLLSHVEANATCCLEITRATQDLKVWLTLSLVWKAKAKIQNMEFNRLNISLENSAKLEVEEVSSSNTQFFGGQSSSFLIVKTKFKFLDVFLHGCSSLDLVGGSIDSIHLEMEAWSKGRLTLGENSPWIPFGNRITAITRDQARLDLFGPINQARLKQLGDSKIRLESTVQRKLPGR